MMSPAKRASLEAFLAEKAKLDRAATEQSGSAGSASGGLPVSPFEPHDAASARLADFVAQSGGTETFPLSFSRLGPQKPRANYVGILPDGNVPVFNINQQAWPVVAFAGDPTTKAQRKAESKSKSSTQHLTLKEEVGEARIKYAAELFEKQKVYKANMIERLTPIAACARGRRKRDGRVYGATWGSRIFCRTRAVTFVVSFDVCHDVRSYYFEIVAADTMCSGARRTYAYGAIWGIRRLRRRAPWMRHAGALWRPQFLVRRQQRWQVLCVGAEREPPGAPFLYGANWEG